MSKRFISKIKRFDWLLTASVFILIGIGLLSLYSISIGLGDFWNFRKQIAFSIAGFILLMIFSFFDWRVLREDPYLILAIYFFCLLALLGLLLFVSPIRGIKGWYKIGPVSLDPIEFTKLILIIILAKYFSLRHIEMYHTKHIILSGLYVFLPAFLIFLQPNLGSALTLIAVWIGILIISGIKLQHFLILCFCGILAMVLGWSFLLKDYQKQRIISFINPQIDPQGISWNINQAKIAIGSGGIFGQGIGKGFQTQFGFLPASQTDFIFAAIAEEMGFFGVAVLLFFLGVVVLRIFQIALKAETNFQRLFASGLAILLGSQIFINIGMNLGLLPIIGIPLPFVSYGGSGLISLCIGLGILQSIRSSLSLV